MNTSINTRCHAAINVSSLRAASQPASTSAQAVTPVASYGAAMFGHTAAGQRAFAYSTVSRNSATTHGP